MHLRVRHWPLKKEEEGHWKVFITVFECICIVVNEKDGWYTTHRLYHDFRERMKSHYFLILWLNCSYVGLSVNKKCHFSKSLFQSNTTRKISCALFLRYHEIIDGFVSKIRHFVLLITHNKWLSITYVISTALCSCTRVNIIHNIVFQTFKVQKMTRQQDK